MSIIRKAGASIALTGSLLLTGGALAGPASAAPPVNQDGLVNVNVGNVNIGNITVTIVVNIALIADVTAQICGVEVKDVAVLARIVDLSGQSRTICEAPYGTVTLVQN